MPHHRLSGGERSIPIAKNVKMSVSHDVQEEPYPLHKLDDLKGFRNNVIWMMRFNDVLDAEKLADALSRLLEIGDWRKLGGRLRFKVGTYMIRLQ